MGKNLKIKLAVDLLMTGALLFLMPYELIGRAAHEWIGTGMLLLFLLHHFLNRRWAGSLLKGRYSPARILQTALVFLALLSILGSIVSGILLSRYVFGFLKWKGAAAFARTLHMACAYWGFVWMSLHLGVHWGMVTGMAAKGFSHRDSAGNSFQPHGRNPFHRGKWIARAAGAVIAGYGAFAFVKREIGSYLLMQIQFVFFDYEEPVFFFILDYMAVMGLFVFLGHYLLKGLKKTGAVKV